MNVYMKKLLEALTAYEAKCGMDSQNSILEALWYDYSCNNPVDDGLICQAEKKLSPVFEELSLEASDCLSDQIVELLNAYQRAAYLDGLRTGARLIMELT